MIDCSDRSQQRGGYYRKYCGGAGDAGAIRVDWLHLIFGLAGAVVVARAYAQDSSVLEPLGRPGEAQARPKILLGALVPRRRIWHDLPGFRIEQDEKVAVFVHHAVILVAE